MSVPTHLWTPRLRPFQDDQSLFQQEPVLSVFTNYRDKHLSVRVFDYIFNELQPSLHTEYWVRGSLSFHPLINLMFRLMRAKIL
jgi:hypothetical protein